MTYTYDLNTDVGRMRRSIPDKSILSNPIQEEDYIWSDEELASFMADIGDWRRASAHVLEVMASDSAYTLQVIRVQNIQTDGSKVADVLMKRADRLRNDAAIADEAAANYGGFDVIELVYDPFTYREKIVHEALREQ